MMLAFTEAGHWHAGIGDPTFMGWMTVVGYFTAALLCWLAGRSDQRAHPQSGYSRQAGLWFGLACMLTLLGINKQLDLQTAFTLAVKSIAQAQGWYEERQFFQVLFIGALAILGIVMIVMLRLLIGNNLRQTMLALAGTVFLTCFVLIRGASFHHVDQMIGLEIGGLRLNWVLELGGILCIGVEAWRNWKRKRPAAPDCRDFVWDSRPESAWRAK